MQVQCLTNPSTDEFCKAVDSFQPNFWYLQGEQLSNDEVGSLVWGGVDLSTPDAISGLFNASTLPTTVCYLVCIAVICSFLNFNVAHSIFFIFPLLTRG